MVLVSNQRKNQLAQHVIVQFCCHNHRKCTLGRVGLSVTCLTADLGVASYDSAPVPYFRGD